MNHKQSNTPLGVSLHQISKVFTTDKKPFVAVDNVSLDVKPSEMVTLLGPSGCGKTTILRMLSGFTMPTAGRIMLGTRDMTDIPPHKRDVGMMFQSYALFPHLTVFENIAYGLRVKHVAAAELNKRVNDVMDLMRITEFSQRIPEQLSGGQQQRVALARAIVTEPNILLFDEPLSNLDAKMREYMRDELRKLQQRLGITSIYVTHDQSEAMAISDKVVIMNHGIIEQTGTPLEIYNRPVNQFVADFMGKANFVKAKVLHIGPQVEVELFGVRCQLEPHASFTPQVGEIVECMLRPEFLTCAKDGAFIGTISRATYLGSWMEYEVEIGGDKVVMVDYEARKKPFMKEGDRALLDIDIPSVRILAPELVRQES